MARATGLVLGIIVIPARRDDIGHRQRAIPHHRACQLSSGGVGFDHHLRGHAICQLRRAVGRLMHQIDADRRAFVVGLHDIGRRQYMARARLIPRHDHALQHRQASRAKYLLRALLVHRQSRGQNTRMGIGDAQPFKDALNAAILTPATVQGVENHFGLDVQQTRDEVVAGIDLDHLISGFPKGVCAFAPRHKRHFPLCGKPTHQNRHTGARPARLARHLLPLRGLVPRYYSLFCGRFADPHDFPL